jgi:glycosyltransferase involved in cell wall biosynthesis
MRSKAAIFRNGCERHSAPRWFDRPRGHRESNGRQVIETLENRTLLRFTHSFRSGGGVEHHLKTLDNILLQRNRMRIIRLFLEKPFRNRDPIVTDIGRGTLIEIPLPVRVRNEPSYPRPSIAPRTPLLVRLKRHIIGLILYTPFYLGRLRAHINRKGFQRGFYEVIDVDRYAQNIMREYDVDLLIMHHAGTIDSSKMIAAAQSAGVPYLFINHFDNQCLKEFPIREQLMAAAAVAGVSGDGIPWGLRRRFQHVSSGIDTVLFDPRAARRPEIEFRSPVILYPARITEAKGQLDLVEICARLRRQGIHMTLVFAGRTDSSEYEHRVKERAKKDLNGEDVFFLGQLDPAMLRDWYAIAAIVAFPTRHHEGLPRIMLEAQAMKVPPVAYKMAGTAQALIHGKTGILVPEGDLAALGQKIEYLLTHEAIRKTMGENGRRFVQERFGLEALAVRHERLYGSVFGKRKRLKPRA